MKTEIYASPYRIYRTKQNSPENHADEQHVQIIVEETDLFITLTKDIDKTEIIKFCTKEIQEIRSIIKFWIKLYPEIQHSLEPIQCPTDAPLCIAEMCKASSFAHVGPFACIAGMIAQFIAAKIHFYLQEKQLCSDVIVENGGDIYLYSSKERIVGILANPKEECTLGLRFAKEQFPLAVCSSSAAIGHSLSFGQGDLSVVIAKNASLADALATSYGNVLKSAKEISTVLTQAQKDSRIAIQDNPFAGAKEKHGVLGVFLQIDEKIGAWGSIELAAIR